MNLDEIMNWPFKQVPQTYSEFESILYALGLGLGADSCDENQLKFVYEKGLVAFPTMALVLGHPGPWVADPSTGIDRSKIVFAGQNLEIHKPLAPKGKIIGQERVLGVLDKGEKTGALICVQRELTCAETGDLLSTIKSNFMCRGDGGCGSTDFQLSVNSSAPEREADMKFEYKTLPQQSLIYRLSGDMNPLHADPAFAQKVGFDKPILHGLATYGIAAHGLLSDWCGYNETRLKAISARFCKPVFPGETLVVESWGEGNDLWFTVYSKERATVVLDQGYATLNGN